MLEMLGSFCEQPCYISKVAGAHRRPSIAARMCGRSRQLVQHSLGAAEVPAQMPAKEDTSLSKVCTKIVFENQQLQYLLQ